MVSVSRSSCTQVSATTERTNCVVSRRAVSYVARSARFALCAASERARTTAVASSSVFVVHPDSCGFGERLAVARNVCGLRPNKANQVDYRAFFFVRDLEEEGRDDLSKSCKVGVRRLSDDRFEVVKEVGEFFHDLLGRHSAPKMARPLSWGSDASVLEVLRKHRD